jgi:uncharacterized short protein YbdD (DUF466 family)
VTDRLATVVTSIARGLRAVLGVPDYERYVEHLRDFHPGCSALSREQFMSESLNARYSKPGTRCC